MVKAWLMAALASMALTAYGEENGMATESQQFDSELAQQLGADQHGMARYVIALLKAGPHRDKSKEEAARLQRAHLDNIHRLAEQGKLLLAGPFLDEGELRGIYIFDVQSVEDARALAETDPSIQSGWLAMELRPWYGSAALRKLPEIVPKITEKPV